MTNPSDRQIIDAWAQPAIKADLLPEVVRLFEQSGSAHLLRQDLSPVHLDGSGGRGSRAALCLASSWHLDHHK